MPAPAADVNVAQLERESQASLEAAEAALAHQQSKLRHEEATTGRKVDKIIRDNDLAEKVRRAFAGELD